ncbi:MAG TPA: RNaseH domain-containing protein [Burkholderiales bacterium]|nr:RNaseH domain-containing protein [Burkholderiales bacterium]
MHAIDDGDKCWTRISGTTLKDGIKKDRKSLVLCGVTFCQPWLHEPVDTLNIHFTGELLQSLRDLAAVAKNTKDERGFLLPVRSLRATLAARVKSLIRVDRNLGLDEAARNEPALLLYGSIADTEQKTILVQGILDALHAWGVNTLDRWAEQFHAEAIVKRIRNAIAPINIKIVPERRIPASSGRNKAYDYQLIIQRVADRLVGAELFAGFGPCEIVLDTEPDSNSVELMTAPARTAGQNAVFSLVAKLSAITVPYDTRLYLRIAMSKRVWSARVPSIRYSNVGRVSGYVMTPDGRIAAIPVFRNKTDGWQFGDEYAVWLYESQSQLPSKLADAVARRVPGQGQWWAGLPELTTLFSRVSPRTVFENDEAELREKTLGLLKSAGVVDQDIDFRPVLIPRRSKAVEKREPNRIAMLKLQDLGIVAGDPLFHDEPEEDEPDANPRIKAHREENVALIQLIYDGVRPVLWSFCSTEDEKRLIESTVVGMFGDSVDLRAELLPTDSHGLKANLPGADKSGRLRFEERVKSWQEAALEVASSREPRYVLICAPDKIAGKFEDPVNYFAGMHAMCAIGKANVHHVLPIGAGNIADSQQHFVHRLQSALLDVFFAHSGLLYGVRNEFEAHFGEAMPNAVYGIQVVRSRARAFSGESSVEFILYTRLPIGISKPNGDRVTATDVRFVYSTKRKLTKSAWMPMREGLQWLASQRDIDPEKNWLRDNFARQTRDFLGEIHKDDPRAVVLIDWQTVRGLWPNLSDADLTTTGRPMIDRIDIASACPKMTLVRVRHGDGSINLRAKTTTIYQELFLGESGSQEIEGPERGVEIYPHTYTTTTKAIVSIDPAGAGAMQSSCGHYIMTMGYRSTVQLPRGQSCYRVMPRMRKVADELYRRVWMQPSRIDAALPAPLEVTVMHCPSDVSPDNVAIAIMALRIGFTHYKDYSKLPAPLFFKRKVEDYIIRYRGPAVDVSDAAEEPDSDLPDTETIAIDDEPEAAADLDAEQVSLKFEQTLNSSTSAVSSPLPDPAESVGSHCVGSGFPDRIDGCGTVEAGDLLGRAKELAKTDILLYKKDAAFARRKLYNSMLTGQCRVYVPVPYFVTQGSIFDGRPPIDKATLGRFWRNSKEWRWVAGACPTLGQIPKWVMNRLNIPQGGISLDGSPLFPRTTLFRAINNGWDDYCESHPHDDGVETARRRIDLVKLTRWACDSNNDVLLAWLVFGAAQFPYKSHLSDVVENVTAILGQATHAALHYFCDCACAIAMTKNRDALERGIHFAPGPRPEHIFGDEQAPQAFGVSEPQTNHRHESTRDVLNMAFVPKSAVHTAVAQVFRDQRVNQTSTGLLFSAVECALTPAPGVVSSALSETNCEWADDTSIMTSLQKAGIPKPGDPHFADAVAKLRAALDDLEDQHQKLIDEREAEAKAAEEAAAAAQRSAELWSELLSNAGALVERACNDLLDLQQSGIRVAAEPAGDIEAARKSFELVQGLIAAAKQAQDEWQAVEDKADTRNMKPLEATRHRKKWERAVEVAERTLEAAYSEIALAVADSPLFVMPVGPQESLDPAVPMAALVDGGHVGRLVAESLVPAGPDREPEPRPHLACPPAVTLPSAPSSVDVDSAGEAVPPRGDEALVQLLVEPFAVRNLAADAKESTRDALPETFVGRSDNDRTPELAEEAPAGAPGSTEFPDGTNLDQRVAVLSTLVDQQVLIGAEIYADAMERAAQPNMLGDHPAIIGAALREIRRLQRPNDQDPARSDRGATQRLLSLIASEKGLDAREYAGQPAIALAVLAAGLHLMLFPETDSGARWTFIQYLAPRFTPYLPLKALIERIENLEGFTITREDIAAAKIGIRDAVSRKLDAMRQRARHWHQDGDLYRNWTTHEYRAIHAAFFQNEITPVGRCLALIARGADGELVDAIADAEKSFATAVNAIDDLRRKIGRRQPIEGQARAHIVKNLRTTEEFIRLYQEAAARAANPQAEVPPNVRQFLQGLYRDIVTAVEFVCGMGFGQSVEILYRTLASHALFTIKAMFDCAEAAPALSNREQLLLLQLPMNSDLTPSIQPTADFLGRALSPVADPLMAMKEVETLSRILEDAGSQITDGAWRREQMQRAFEFHLMQRRMLPAEIINKQYLEGANSTACGDARNRNVLELTAELHKERQRVLHAVAVAGLSQSESDRMREVIERLLSATPLLGMPGAEVHGIPDFPHAYGALRELVRDELDATLEQSVFKLRQEAEEFYETHKDTIGRSDIDRIFHLVSDRSASSIRTAADMLSLLRDGALPPARAASDANATEYVGFIRTVRSTISASRPLIESVERRLHTEHSQEDPAWIGALSSDERIEGLHLVQTWISLTTSGNPRETEEALKRLFAVLDVEITVAPISRTEQKIIDFFLPDGPFAGMERTHPGLFIPPSLGSQKRPVQGILLRGNMTDAAISQLIEDRCHSTPTLVLTKNPMPLEKRAAICRDNPVLILDDELLAYVALHPKDRLARLLHVALLTYHDSPYDDYGAQPVPTEMFFGRRQERNKLRNVKSSAILYGGRRLGKSSLLAELHYDTTVNGADRGEEVIYIPFAATSDLEDHVSVAWSTIYRKLVQSKFIPRPSGKTPTSAKAIREYLEEMLATGQASRRSLYMLIDEADDIMGRDLIAGGQFVAELQRLCESVRGKCNIRFVITGLHNLTRMANEENSPLGKFDAIALKPFWSAEDIQRGIDLITVPLAGLGFYFGSGKDDLAYRIMAVCNFYPALIQLYCKSLLAHLYNKREVAPPPTFIDESDLDKVENDSTFLREIQTKFVATLNLDKRYKAIALVLADHYYSANTERGLTVPEVRELCETYFPEQFRNTFPDAYNSLLDEMEILTVLKRVQNRYMLRTPNIATMLGNRDDIDRLIEELAMEKANHGRLRGEMRSILTPFKGGREHHTFPMASAWTRSVMNVGAELDRDVLILVGNALSGLSTLNTLKGDWQIGEAGAATNVLDVKLYPSPEMARTILVRETRASREPNYVRRIHCVAEGSWKLHDLQQYASLSATVAPAIAADGTLRGQMRRLALLCNTERAYEVAQLWAARQADAPLGWRPVPAPVWTEDALYFRKDLQEKAEIREKSEVLRTILDCTCGFGVEVDRLCSTKSLSIESITESLSAAERRLAPDLTTLYKHVGIAPAISREELRSIEDVLRALHGKKRDPLELEELCKAVQPIVTPAMIVYFQWMGLLQDTTDGTWYVPSLYARLLH